MAQIAVALDTPHVEQGVRWARMVAPHVSVLKLGLEFYLRNGAKGVKSVRDSAPNCGLFLDLKLHDIPATVAGGARSVASLSPEYLTVHASGGSAMVAAAAQALPETRITAVTVLTSLSQADLEALRLGSDAAELAVAWADLAVSAGASAIVSSALETRNIRRSVGDQVQLVTPGIRPRGSAVGDQSRVVTPADAVAVGSDLLVVGRPITGAEDPAAAAEEIAHSVRIASA
jgi:orotidine-5'-phosphate decarboxylase